MSLSIIIVNYRSSNFIINCINSALKFNSAKEFEWVIVDNNSNDNSKSILTQQFPFVKWIETGYNAGFARANNVGIKASNGNVVLLLNADTIINSNAIYDCYNAFIQSNFIACGVQLLNTDGTPQISGNYAMKGGLNYLLPLPYLGNTLKFVANILKVKKPNIPNATTVAEVDWINGAFLMVKKSVIEKAGLLDEDFFLYAEEAEWCSRLKKYGSLCIYGEYNIVHLQGETTNSTFESKGKGYYNLYDKKGLQIMVSNFVRIRKQFGIICFLFQLMVYSIEVPVFFILQFFDNLLQFKNPFNNYSKVFGFTKNVFTVWKLTPTIVKNKPYFYKML